MLFESDNWWNPQSIDVPMWKSTGKQGLSIWFEKDVCEQGLIRQHEVINARGLGGVFGSLQRNSTTTYFSINQSIMARFHRSSLSVTIAVVTCDETENNHNTFD